MVAAVQGGTVPAKRGRTPDDTWTTEATTPATGAHRGTTALAVGLVSFLVPLLGIAAVVLGADVLRDPRQNARQAERAFNGLVAGAFSTILWIVVIVWVITFGLAFLDPERFLTF